MLPLQIKRQRKPNTEPKQTLRTHVEKLPLDQQHAFVVMALQLLRGRIDSSVVEKTGSYQQPRHEWLQERSGRRGERARAYPRAR
jgi:hypothetical protein